MEPTKFIRKWGKKRARGLMKHALLYGATVPVGGLFGGIIGNVIGQGDVYKTFVKSSTIYGVSLLFVVGLGLGVSDWYRNERKYSLLTEKSK